MTSRDILNAMGGIDAKLILDAAPAEKKKWIVQRKWVKWGMMTACFGILAMLLISVANAFMKHTLESEWSGNELVGELPSNPEVTDTNPSVDEKAHYSAEEIQALFDIRKNDVIATSYYTKVYVPSAEDLKVPSFLTEETIAIYEKKELIKTLDEKEFTDFLDGIVPRLFEQIGETIRPYEIEERISSYLGDSLDVALNENGQLRKYFVNAEQTKTHHTIILSSYSQVTNPTGSISLGDVNVEVNQAKTDREILKELEVVQEKLFTIFGVEFADAKIVRKYDGYSEYGANWLTVYFYDEEAHPLNKMSETPISDYIRVGFDNFANTSDDILSDTILQDVSIMYRQNRIDVNESYVEREKLKMISLEDAEAMLCKGYVFGGHSCPYCMAEQEAVDFEGYDYVGMTYVTGWDDNGNETECVPFYVFYKYIELAENGNQTYAKTYVPAIAVSGCEAYFESQKQYHNLDTMIEEQSE